MRKPPPEPLPEPVARTFAQVAAAELGEDAENLDCWRIAAGRHPAAAVPARADATGARRNSVGERGAIARWWGPAMISLEETMRSVLARAVAAGERWRTGVAYNPLSAAMARRRRRQRRSTL